MEFVSRAGRSKPDRTEAWHLDARTGEIHTGHQPKEIHLQPAAHAHGQPGKAAEAQMQIAAILVEIAKILPSGR